MSGWLLLFVMSLAGETPATTMGQGSVLAPADAELATDADPVGLNPFHPNTRTPTGWLYPLVRQPDGAPAADSGGWQLRYGLQLGGVLTAGQDGAARYREYGDTGSGLVANRFLLDARQPDTLRYLRATGGSLGRDDAFVQLDWGRTGRYNLGLWYSQMPHVFSTSARVLWNGAGTGVLSLPAPLDRTSSADAVRSTLLGRGTSELALEREQWGLGFDINPRRSLRLFAHARLDQKKGSRPFGATMAFPGTGQFTEIIEPLDQRTTNLSGGLQWTGGRQQANLTWAASYFRNDIPALRWDNPALSPFSFFAPPSGQMALAPDNDYRTIKVDYAASVDFWRSRFTATYADALFEQNDALLPPTISSGVVSDGDVVDLDNWNTLSALSRRSAEAEREQQLLRLKWVSQPRRGLRLQLHYRDEQRDNNTRYSAFNPLTGELGVVVLDGALLSIPGQGGIYRSEVPGSRVRIATIPFGRDRSQAGIGAEYRITSRSRLGLDYARHQADYRFRERTGVDDDVWRAHWTWRGQGTLRAAFETVRRTGDGYHFNPYEPFFSSSLPDFQGEFADGTSPVTLSALRKFDLASFDRDRAELKWHIPLGNRADLNLSGYWQTTDYEADYGLKDSDEQGLNVDWSLRLSASQSLYAYASMLRNERTTAGIAANGNNTAAFAADASPGGINFPFDSAWQQRVDDRHRVVGLGWTRRWERVQLSLDYTLSKSRSGVGYEFASSAALVRGVDEAGAGTGFPALQLKNEQLEGNLRWQVRDGLALRLLYRYEAEDLIDFHYLGLLDPVVEVFGATDLYLAAGPQRFRASLLAFLVELTPRG